jgi:hypothetical protein
MKAFYWQLGLHIQPDTEEESKALALVFNSITKSTLAEARAEEPHHPLEMPSTSTENASSAICNFPAEAVSPVIL